MPTRPVATVALVGFGGVGRALARRLSESAADPDRLDVRAIAVVDSSGAIFDPDGVDLTALLREKERTGRLKGPGFRAARAEEAIARTAPDVVIEVSPSDPLHGRPALDHILAAFDAGSHVVTSNKGAIAFHGLEIEAAARQASREVRFSTTVGGGVPVLDTVCGRLRDARVQRITGILNGTTQFVLSALAGGASYDDAVGRARALGLTESDPRGDLGGHDAALKAAILSQAVFRRVVRPESVPRDPLTPGATHRLRDLSPRGRTLAVLTEVAPDAVSVRLTEVARSGPWDVSGATNVVRVDTVHAGTVWIEGPGAGPEATASGLLADLRAVLGSRPRRRRAVAAGGIRAPSGLPDPAEVDGTAGPVAVPRSR